MDIMEYSKKQQAAIDEAKARMEAHKDSDAYFLAIMNSAVAKIDALRDQANEGRKAPLLKYSYEELQAKRAAEDREGIVQE